MMYLGELAPLEESKGWVKNRQSEDGNYPSSELRMQSLLQEPAWALEDCRGPQGPSSPWMGHTSQSTGCSSRTGEHLHNKNTLEEYMCRMKGKKYFKAKEWIDHSQKNKMEGGWDQGEEPWILVCDPGKSLASFGFGGS